MSPDYFFEQRPLGVFVLINSLREQPDSLNFGNLDSQFCDSRMQLAVDFNYIWLVSERLKLSLLEYSRWDVAIDATSVFLFVRIYYDSISHLIHLLFRALNPSMSRRWPTTRSFAEQLKWFKKHSEDSYFNDYSSCLSAHGFEAAFEQMRSIRNALKSIPSGDITRLAYLSRGLLPRTGNLRNEVGHHLYECLRFTDFVGDYFLMKIEETIPIARLEVDYHGQDRGLLASQHAELYKWFSTKPTSGELARSVGRVGTFDRDIMMGFSSEGHEEH